MNHISELEQVFSLFTDDYLHKAGSSFIIILILWIFRYFLLRVVKHQTSNLNTRYTWRKATFYLLVFLSIILVGRLWLNGLQPILALLGIIAAALTISLKELILNGAGIIVILWRNIFSVGDRIEIDAHKGDVVGIGLFYFTLIEVGNWVTSDQSTGRLIKVPNSLILTKPIINYTKSFPFIWDEISITVTFESNWKKARAILLEIAQAKTESCEEEIHRAEADADHHELIRYHHFEPKVYIKPVEQAPAGIFLTLRYLCKPRKRRDSEDILWEEILDRFEAAEDITISHK